MTLSEYCDLHYIQGKIEGVGYAAETVSKEIATALFDASEVLGNILSKTKVEGVELPPHGNLIDVDVLISNILDYINTIHFDEGDRVRMEKISQIIADAPVVMEAKT